MERWTDKKRSYPDGIIPRRTNALSFIASKREELGGIDQTQVTDGEVTVKRFGKYEQVYYKPEEAEVLTEPGIILSSAQKECYLIKFKVNKTSVEVKSQAKKIHLPHTVFFADTFVNPDENSLLSLAETFEICPFIYTLDHKKFIIVIGGESGGLTLKARDDWHYNYCQNLADIPTFDVFRWYYYSWFPVEVKQSDQYLQGYGWNYSFSPFTYCLGLFYLNRFIDHNKRLYIPILGRGETFAKVHPKLAGCENGRYGKKPFTITKDGIVSYKEVVRMGGAVMSPEGYGPAKYYGYNMQTYWPFIPYMCEIANLDIQAGKRDTSLWYPAFFYNYKMQYYTDNGMVELPLRSDVIDGSFPVPVNVSTIVRGIVELVNSNSGTNTVTVTRSQTSSFNLKKYSSIGTIGNLKDLHVLTELAGNMSSEYSDVQIVQRVSDFPDMYYDISWVDDLLWSGDSYHDVTNCSMDVNIKHTNKITGTQKLMAGDIEIDSGSILMDFVGTEVCEKTHDGTTDWVGPPPCTRIAYTTLQMSTNGVQTLTSYDADGNICDVFSSPSCEWRMISGGGSVDPKSGVYTAPATNPNCENNPVIGLFCNDVLLDSINIAVNAYNFCGAFWTGLSVVCQYSQTVVSYGIYNCLGVLCASTNGPCGGPSGTWTACPPTVCNNMGTFDTRSDAQKLAGCCPSQLL